MNMLILLCLFSGCATTTQPDLERLYQQNREVNQPPVIVIHGIMGSRLEDSVSGEEVWVGSLSKLVLSEYREIGLEIDPESWEQVH